MMISKMMERTSWVCYLCGIGGSEAKIHKRRVRISTTSRECVYLCDDCLPSINQVIEVLRG